LGVGTDANETISRFQSTNFDEGEWFLVKGQWQFGADALGTAIKSEDTQLLYSYGSSAAEYPKNGPLKDRMYSQFNLTARKINWDQNLKLAKSAVVLPEVPVTAAAYGQNSKKPVPMFNNHVVVRIGSLIYDPSYGKKYDSRKDFEEASIAGFAVLGQAPTKALYGGTSMTIIDAILIRKPPAVTITTSNLVEISQLEE
jgi:hypothetical protein